MVGAKRVDTACEEELATGIPPESDTETFLESDDELSHDFIAMAFDPSVTAESAAAEVAARGARRHGLRRPQCDPVQLGVAPAHTPPSGCPMLVPAAVARPQPLHMDIAPQQVVTVDVVTFVAIPMQNPTFGQPATALTAVTVTPPPQMQSLGQRQRSDEVARPPEEEFGRPNAGARRSIRPPGAAVPVQQTGGVRLIKAARPPSELRNKGRNITTLSINNLPIRMRKKQLLDLLDRTGFEGRYDFMYLPFNKTTNQGHAFVNLCSMQDAKAFFAEWHGTRIAGVDGSSNGPVLSLGVCKTQGFESCAKLCASASVRDPDRFPFIAPASHKL